MFVITWNTKTYIQATVLLSLKFILNQNTIRCAVLENTH